MKYELSRIQKNNLRFFRRAAELTQDDVAALLQIDQSLVSRIERGFRRPTEEQRRCLAETLGVSAHELFPKDVGE